MEVVAIAVLIIVNLYLLLALQRMMIASIFVPPIDDVKVVAVSVPKDWQQDSEIVGLMYAEAQQLRSISAATVDELRVRAAAALTILATTTAIFVAVATTGGKTRPSISGSPLELTALSLFAVAAFAFAIILMPLWTWSFWPDVDRMKDDADEDEDPSKASIELLAIDNICSDYAIDLPKTKRLQYLFSAGIVCFVGEIVFWIFGILR